MENLEAKRDALNAVLDAAKIHSQTMTESLSDYGMQPGFKDARWSYIRRLDDALSVARQIKLDTEGNIRQRVSDLSLEEATDLLHAAEDRIRALRRHNLSEFA